MTKREFFENELKMKPSEIGTAIPFNQNGETEVTEGWLISFIKNLLAERNKWHTGTPTKEGWYLQRIKSKYNITYDTDYYENGDWKYSCIFREIVEWQKIEEKEETI